MKIFISYPSEEVSLATCVKGILESNGYDAWFDEERFYGDDIDFFKVVPRKEIKKEILERDAFILIISGKLLSYANSEEGYKDRFVLRDEWTQIISRYVDDRTIRIRPFFYNVDKDFDKLEKLYEIISKGILKVANEPSYGDLALKLVPLNFGKYLHRKFYLYPSSVTNQKIQHLEEFLLELLSLEGAHMARPEILPNGI